VGKSFDLEKADPAVKKALETVPEDAQKLMAWKVATLARIVHGWSMNTDTMGVYSNYYLKRAIITQFGLGANLPEDAIYPLNLGDSEGKPPDGTNNYTIHFEKEQIPPVQAFWSITLYDPEGFSGGKHDRSVCRLELDAAQIQCQRRTRVGAPTGRRTGCLRLRGPYNLTMRLYAPKSEALTGKWAPPQVNKVPAGITLPQ
jgi:hypothetical protein